MARQAAGAAPRWNMNHPAGGVAMAASPFADPFGSPQRTSRYMPASIASSSVDRTSTNKYIGSDRADLEQWAATADVGDQKRFKAGKKRRKCLHRACDSLQAEHP